MDTQRQRVGVYAESESSITISFTYQGVRCKERIKLQPTPANLKRAEQHRAAILHAIEQGTFDYALTFPDSKRRFQFSDKKSDGYPLRDYLETWLNEQKPHLKASTFDDYKKIVFNTLIPAFGDTFMPELSRPQIVEWCKAQTCGNKRLANIQSVLRLALQDALDDNTLDSNILHGWKYARKEAPKPNDDVDPLDADEQALMLKNCRHPQHENLFRFMLWTGLRTSEVAALEWGDVDWVKGYIRVQRAKTLAAEEAEAPKTRAGARDVKLLPEALRALEAQKQYTFLAQGVVFHNPRTGEAWNGDQPIRNAWLSALTKAGIRHRRAYQTRHTYASMMLSAGESPLWLKGQMGHSDLNMIYRTYARWINDADPNAGMKAHELFIGENGQNPDKKRTNHAKN